tara:strand:+ start:156 stop:464 length:309 start_codon:yes stop_codon:yes gene_type:complete
MKKEVTDQELREVLKSDKLIVIQFHAPWCGPCKVVGPRLDTIADIYGDKIEVVSINVDENEEHSTEFGIRNVPTVLMFKGGASVYKQVGIGKDYIDAIEKHK